MHAAPLNYSPRCRPIQLKFYWKGSSQFNGYEIKQLDIGIEGLNYLITAPVPAGYTPSSLPLEMDFIYIEEKRCPPPDPGRKEDFIQAMPDEAESLRIRAKMVKSCIERRLSFTNQSGEQISPRREIVESVELQLESIPHFERDKKYFVFIKNKDENFSVKFRTEGELTSFDNLLGRFLDHLPDIDWKAEPKKAMMNKAIKNMLGEWLLIFSVEDFQHLLKEGESLLLLDKERNRQIASLIDFLALCAKTKEHRDAIEGHLMRSNLQEALQEANSCHQDKIKECAFVWIVTHFLELNRLDEASEALDKMPPGESRLTLQSIYLAKKLEALELKRKRSLSQSVRFDSSKEEKETELSGQPKNSDGKKRCIIN